MWYFALIVFGLWNGAFSANQTCIENLRYACRNIRMLPDELPGTEAELQQACSELETIKRCLMKRLKRCGSNSYDDLEIARSELPGMINTLTEICQEDTYLHEPLQRKQLQDDEEYRYKISRCLFPLLSMNCFITHISSSCEYGAGKMTLELIQRAATLDEQCPASVRIDAIDLLNAFESATEEEVELEVTFSKAAKIPCAFSANQTCIEDLRWACSYYRMIPNEFPGTEDELRESCSELENIKRCLMERLNECGTNNYDDLEIARSDLPRMINTLTEICQEDTELHASYVQHMACIKRIISMNNEKQFCRDYTTSAMAYLRGPIQRKKLEDDPDYRYKFSQCLIPLMDMNCFITYISGSCEHGAGKMSIELIQKAGSVAEQCPASIRIDVIDLLNAFESATEEEMFVKRLIRSLNLS
ncbi:uncharacterized protein CDAR_427201 [Caerostris darwini]|uniref:Secreted protein n=1 Tax=Caerostris darwini TaxID=1538125 RepID=A0AAV4PQ08_9ARAC|nr:uncharacterized protein CDAR_427201 [Caerostris darwini]